MEITSSNIVQLILDNSTTRKRIFNRARNHYRSWIYQRKSCNSKS